LSLREGPHHAAKQQRLSYHAAICCRHFFVKGGKAYGKKVVNHYRSCCDCLIIDSGVHVINPQQPNGKQHKHDE
jgi:hypothetical protein